MIEKLLETLNPQQREAVETNQGSLLVFAGAGSGKTRVITTKIAYAIDVLGIKPYQILAVTFTNKACKEMQERVATMVDPELAGQAVIRTFHSFGVWILRRYGEIIGIPKNFTIYDDKESFALLCQCFPNEDKEELKKHSISIALAKEKNLPVEGKYYQAYQSALKDTGNVDFGDLIIKPIELLKNNPQVREEVQKRFKYILVDEYQDTNPSQLQLLKLVVGPESFICVVGDDDQSIYRFRSADVKTILSFPQHFKNTKTVVLGTNYRCSSSVLEVAKDVIDHNKQRQSKNLQASKLSSQLPVLSYYSNENGEADDIVKKISAMPAGQNRTTAILYRTNAQSRVFENKLTYYHIPYQVVGDLSFYSREEIVDATAAVKLLINRYDTVSFARLASKLLEGVGQATIEKILTYSQQSGFDVLLSADSFSQTKKSIKNFCDTYQNISLEIGNVKNSELVKKLLTSLGMYEYFRVKEQKEGLKYSSRVEDLNQFVAQFEEESFSNDLEGLASYIESRALDSNMGDSPKDEKEVVTLITMHRTKGLEFDRVFVTGLEDNIFFKAETSKDDIEEERRLCYVAFTRARTELYLSCCDSRFLYGYSAKTLPLSFLSEIKPAHIKVLDKRDKESFFGYGNKYGGGYSNTYSNIYSKKSVQEKILKPKHDSYDSWEPKVEKPKVTVIKKAAVKTENAPKLQLNDRVRNEILGEGTVTALKKFGERNTVVITYDSGKMGTYLADNAPLKKI